ncbi:SAGA-associated factor 29 [Choanephora cucurbitarum]|uniref:SAGA-associated factor 29 n=1 Tax=Choanephora cucurbitarum TaxID=101091 RepID=A0A1C7NCK1_9FUNG|nr:SAGA-associated factor 29 [Choanephora cucurbitarum]
MERKSRSSRIHDDLNDESNLWKQICSSLFKLEGIQREEEGIINTINKVQLSLDSEKVSNNILQQKLKDNYRRGIELSTHETRIIQDVIEKLSVLIALRDSEQDQKRKRRKLENDSKTLGNGNSSYVFTKGTTVAARQPSKEKDKSEEWILAVVIQYHADKNKYEVEDVDQDDYGEKQRYMLPPRYVIPVLSSEEARLSPEIPAQQDVLALYPGTTCFYKATVVAPPSKSKEIKNYRVRFEDDNNEVKYVMPEHVLEMPKTK